jgi:hypothetical protein
VFALNVFLFFILIFHMEFISKGAEGRDNMPSYLIVLTELLKGSPPLQSKLIPAVFPAKELGDSLSAASKPEEKWPMVRLVTCPHPSTSQAAGEFLFALCGEDGERIR